MKAFPFTSCVPFSNNTPLQTSATAPDQVRRERSGLLFRASAHEAPPPEVLATLERLLGLDGADALHYADRNKGQRRTMRLVRSTEGQAELTGFVLAGDTSAQAWITTLLKDELPAQTYGRLLLLPGATPPVAVQSRGKPVCSCFNVSDIAITEHLQNLQNLQNQPRDEGDNSGAELNDEARLTSLQAALKCGTNCGSCVPELKRRVRASHSAGVPAARLVIPIQQIT